MTQEMLNLLQRLVDLADRFLAQDDTLTSSERAELFDTNLPMLEGNVDCDGPYVSVTEFYNDIATYLEPFHPDVHV